MGKKVENNVLFMSKNHAEVSGLKNAAGEPQDYLVNSRFPSSKPRLPGANGVGKYSLALHALKYAQDGVLETANVGDEYAIRFPGHEVYVKTEPGKFDVFTMSAGDHISSTTTESIVLAVLCAYKFKREKGEDIWKYSPECFCDAVYFGFAQHGIDGIDEVGDYAADIQRVFNGTATAAAPKAKKAKAKANDDFAKWETAARNGEFAIDCDWAEEAKAVIPDLQSLNGKIFTKRLKKICTYMRPYLQDAAERIKQGLAPLGVNYLAMQLFGNPACGKSTDVRLIAAIFQMPLWVLTVNPDAGTEIIEGETKVVESNLQYCRSIAGKALEYGGVLDFEEIVGGDTDRLIAALNVVLEEPYEFYENGIELKKRHPLSAVMCCYNTSTEAGRALAPSLMSRFSMCEAYDVPEKELMLQLMEGYMPNAAYNGYDKSELFNWVYETYTIAANFVSNRAPRLAEYLSVRACFAMLRQINAGIEPKETAPNLWGLFSFADANVASGLRDALENSMKDI